MDLVARVTLLAQRMGAESKSLRTLVNGNVASLAALTTADKSNLVAAINEIKAEADAVSSAVAALNIPVIDDAHIASNKTWSSQKISDSIQAAKDAILGGVPAAALDTIKELADALANDQSAVAALTTAIAGAVRFDQAQTLTAAQKTQACANIGIGEPDTDFVALFNAALV